MAPSVVTRERRRDENEDMEQIFYPVLDDLFRKGNFNKRFGRYATKMIPRDGTAVLRYEWAGQPTKWVEAETPSR